MNEKLSGKRGANVNDFYYRVRSVAHEKQGSKHYIDRKGWLSWREVCELRRQGEIEIVEKKPVEEQ